MSDIDLTEVTALTRKVIADRWNMSPRNRDVKADADTILTAALPHIERQVREQVAREIEAVDPVEWALAGQSAGADAARIARGDHS